MSKLSAEAQIALLRKQADREAKRKRQSQEEAHPPAAGFSPGASSRATNEAGEEVITLLIQYNGDPDELTALGFTIRSRAGHVYVGFASPDRVEDIAQHPGIIRIDTPGRSRIALDKSIPDVKANQVWARSGTTFSGLTGKDVVVGIVDTGIDYQHKAFRDPADPTKSRIMAIWDQTLGVPGDPKAPGRFTPGGLGESSLQYGREFSREEIQSALASPNPRSVVEHRDIHGHGTHVAGTAAGNGAQPGGCGGPFQYVGVAPEADIIMVRMFGLTHQRGGYAGDEKLEPTPIPDGSNPYTDAVNYIIERARRGNPQRPVAINLSLGTFIGPRDGSHGDEQTIDFYAGVHNTGVAIVVAAGNEADESRHARGTVAASGSAVFTLDVAHDTVEAIQMDVRYTGNNLRARLKPPGSDAAWQSWTLLGQTGSHPNLNNGGSASVANRDNHILFSLDPAPREENKPPPQNLAGKWQFELDNTTATATPIDIYVSENSLAVLYNTDLPNNGLPAGFSFTTEATMNVKASAANIIAVGAYSVEGDTNNQLAAFSNHGPVLRTCGPADDPFCEVRPHLVAPGVAITATATDEERPCPCCCDCCEDFYMDKQGTSMATPHVTGAVALMLQKNKTRPFRELRTDLLSGAAGRRDIAIPGVDPIPPATWPRNDVGWGKLDVKAAVDLTPVEPPPPPPPPPPPDPADPFMPDDLAIEEPVADATPAAAPVSPAGPPASVVSLRSRLLATGTGRRLNRLVQTHFREVRDLVNTNKRVAVTWHRNHGPAMIRLAMRLANAPAEPLPVLLAGEPLFDCADRIVEVVSRYASDALRRDALPYRHLIEHLRYGLSPEDWVRIIEQLEAPAPAVPVA